MQYDSCIVDVFNLYFRLKKEKQNHRDICKSMINCIENDVKSHLKKAGKIYLIYDAIVESDLGVSKAFTVTTTRQQILPDYKSNRKHDNLIMDTVSLFKKYYTFRGDKILNVYDSLYEADDFIEPIIDSLSDESIAILTNDMDAARYLSIKRPARNRIDIINKHWDEPLTAITFEKMFQFKPGPVQNTFYKALFGDSSDNITGVIFIKKAKFSVPIKEFVKTFIQDLAKDENLTIDSVLDMFKFAKFNEIANKKEKTNFERLYFVLKNSDLKIPVFQTLYDNVSVIRSKLTGADINKFLRFNQNKPEMNSVIHESIFGIEFKTQFGKT